MRLQLGLAILCIVAVGCSKKTDEGSTGDSIANTISLPRITGPVETNSPQAKIQSRINTMSTGIALNGDYPSPEPSPSPNKHKNIFDSASSYVNQGDLADKFSCIFEKMVGAGLAKVDGTEYILKNTEAGDNSTTKFKISSTNGSLDSYKMYSCNLDVNANKNYLYLGGNNINNVANFTFKVDMDTTLKFYSQISGDYVNGAWQNKTADVQLNVLNGLVVSNYTLTQYEDYMSLKQVILFLGFVERMFASTNLYGNSVSTYQMGSGSAKYCLVNSGVCGSDTIEHWSDAGITANDSTLSATMQAGVYPTALTAIFDKDLTTEETWDCTDGSAVVINESNFSPALATSISTSCNGQ